MPFAPKDAKKFNKNASTKKSQKAFQESGNSALRSGKSEKSAIKIANSAANKSKGGK